jgi:hypothetical protein
VSPDPSARQIQSYCTSRRKLVDQRTNLTNRLQATLKHYFPEAILLMHENVFRTMNLEMLRKWPTAQSMKRARSRSIEKFFHAHGSRSAARLKARLEIIERMEPLTENPAIIDCPALWKCFAWSIKSKCSIAASCATRRPSRS